MLADEPMALVKPKADRLLGGKNRSNWKLPCTKGTNLLVLCDSQAKRVQRMRLKLFKFDRVGHYVADDTLVINVCYGEVGHYGAGDTLVINVCYHLQMQRSSTMPRYIY